MDHIVLLIDCSLMAFIFMDTRIKRNGVLLLTRSFLLNFLRLLQRCVCSFEKLKARGHWPSTFNRPDFIIFCLSEVSSIYDVSPMYCSCLSIWKEGTINKDDN